MKYECQKELFKQFVLLTRINNKIQIKSKIKFLLNILVYTLKNEALLFLYRTAGNKILLNRLIKRIGRRK